MTKKAFSIRDAKAEVFHTPFFSNSFGEAERDFRTAVNDKQTSLNKFPEDFDLYYVGDYDDNTGVFKSLDTPQHIVKAISCIAPKMQPDLSIPLNNPM